MPANAAFTSTDRIVPRLRNSSPGKTHTVLATALSDVKSGFESWEAAPTANTFGAAVRNQTVVLYVIAPY